MGKGEGDHPPQKFIHDQCFCQLFIFMFMGTCVTLSSLSAPMDDGGSSPFPYFFTGFVLAPILLVNLISRMSVVKAVQKKGLTRKNIVDVLQNTKCGKYIWPWSCRIGMLWCIPGTILTGIAGVNCGIEEKEDGNITVRNTCYYDIEGPQADMYKGMATGLLVVHIFSFVYLFMSNCPVHSVLEQIKEDTRVNPTNNRPTVSPASNSNNASAAAASSATNEMEMKTLIQKLETRVRELENRERQVREIDVIPPPPSYDELMNSTYKNAGAFPGDVP